MEFSTQDFFIVENLGYNSIISPAILRVSSAVHSGAEPYRGLFLQLSSKSAILL